jgi:uncharacterized protein with HEPN domain
LPPLALRMLPDDETRFTHMLDASVEALSFVAGKTREDLENDRQLVLALIKSIEIIGEAAARISAEAKTTFDDIPWADIVGMRNRLIHAYFDVDLDILWETVMTELPPLQESIKRSLRENS